MNFGRMLVRIKVSEWKSENVAKGMMETACKLSPVVKKVAAYDSRVSK